MTLLDKVSNSLCITTLLPLHAQAYIQEAGHLSIMNGFTLYQNEEDKKQNDTRLLRRRAHRGGRRQKKCCKTELIIMGINMPL